MATKKPKEAGAPSVEETREQEAAVEEAASSEERVPSAFYEVQVNRALRFTDRVSVGGNLFYYDNTVNREQGTWVLDDVQYEDIKSLKDPETGLQYIVRKSTISSEANEGGE